MTQILITPVLGTARSIAGKVMTGGHHYLLVDKNEISVRNALTQEHAVALEGVEIEKRLSPREVDQLVRELEVSRIRGEDESYEDYRANLYRFAVESLSSKLEDEAEDTEEKPKTRTSKTPKTPKTATATDAQTSAENTGE